MDPKRYPESHSSHYSRRRVLQYGAAAAAAGTFAPWIAEQSAGAATPTVAKAALREAGQIPYPKLPVGKHTGLFPFDHIVLVMQENHSFDNYLGMLPVSGQPKADGFTFNKKEQPINWNPIGNDRMYAYPQLGDIGTSDSGSQSWNDSHQQINSGAMNGFAETGPGSMGYYTEDDLPFYYSLAKTFTLANRWFCSVPAQTYPNRRFLMAGTASGVIETSLGNVSTYPKNGTIWDLLSKCGVSWHNYFTDAPTTAIILDTEFKHTDHLRRIEQFYLDAAAGTLPAVSLVDCNMGAVQGEVAGIPGDLPAPIPTFTNKGANAVRTTCESEENPEDVQLGEAFVSRIANAVMKGAAWQRTLMIWFYDEHGGYYDHVAPPAAIEPDNIAPDLASTNAPGAYNLYGPRIPAVVISPYSKKHDVTNVVHDHTSVLNTIERQWNLPHLTRRDANATTIADFLDVHKMQFPEPPELAKPANPAPGLEYEYKHGRPVAPAPADTVPTGGTTPAK